MSTASEKMMNDLVEKANVGREGPEWRRGKRFHMGGYVIFSNNAHLVGGQSFEAILRRSIAERLKRRKEQ